MVEFFGALSLAYSLSDLPIKLSLKSEKKTLISLSNRNATKITFNHFFYLEVGVSELLMYMNRIPIYRSKRLF